jgi:hypothetical protein
MAGAERISWSGRCRHFLLLVAMLHHASSATAQLVAFPGAEGAGKLAIGGRDGDVYVVSNLNDSGAGSLREAINTAPSSGRTIVFSVGGTINLLTDIDITRPKITVAGQTAPGGITLARRALRISNTNNIILQHIAVRPGDFYTAPNVYEPDSIWVNGSNNVILDHVSASWSTDEVLSVTHGSTNVTVQWSLITEALHNSNHSKGNHGYGGIIHGGETTLHHNLYAHNRSRNPATGNWDKDVPITPAHLDIVNNVIFNPGDRYSYSGGDDQYQVNWTGNFGIEGPNTTRENELFHPDNVNSLVYYANNYYDTDEDGILQVTPASASTLTGVYTSVGSPIATTNPPNQTSAPIAYTQILSYSGAAAHRDAIDKRVINSVVRQNGAHIDSQNQVGGWLYPTPTSTVIDPDGLPDWWKIKRGLNPNDNTIGRQKPVPGGYTYLELYLHELNKPYQSPTTTVQRTVSTAFGAGADAMLSENSGVTGGNGSGSSLAARWNNADRNEYIALRFDLSQIEPGSIADAALELTVYQSLSNQTLRVYGLDHDTAGQLWDESSVTFAQAPGLTSDNDSTTRGRVDARLLPLGQFTTGTRNEGDVISFTNLDLTAFLNLLAYRNGQPANIVTLLLERQSISGSQTLFASKEATQLATGFPAAAGTYAPRLILDASSNLPGDFNHNGRVDAADYIVWRNTDGTPDGYNTWRTHFGESLSVGSGAAVPEPTSAFLMLMLVVSGNCRQRLINCSTRRRPY